MNNATHPSAIKLTTLPSLLLSGMLILGLAGTTFAEEMQESETPESWLPNLVTETSQEGFALAVKLSQKGVGTTQPDTSVRKTLRGAYANDPDSLIAASQVIAIHFQTVAAANDYWREE